MTSIFQIDWISIDITIIVLLLLLLFSIKIFKITHRWRYSFSNQALLHKCFFQTHKKTENQIIITKKWCLTRNSKTNCNLPLILILRTDYKRKLLRVFSEGLSSYGFNIINIKIKINYNPDNKLLENSLINEWKSLISTISKEINIVEATKLKYILITTSKSIISYKSILSDPDLKAAILINPQLNKKISSDYDEVFKKSSILPQIFIIFSRKSIIIFKNKEIQKFYRQFANQKNNIIKPITIERTNYSFKYYETIILGMIIDFIENKLLKSEFNLEL